MSYNRATREAIEAFGITNQRLPVNGSECAITFRGVVIWINPKDQNNVHKRAHRLIARCPECSKEVGYSRLKQHMQAHGSLAVAFWSKLIG